MTRGMLYTERQVKSKEYNMNGQWHWTRLSDVGTTARALDNFLRMAARDGMEDCDNDFA